MSDQNGAVGGGIRFQQTVGVHYEMCCECNHLVIVIIVPKIWFESTSSVSFPQESFLQLLFLQFLVNISAFCSLTVV